MCIRDSDQPIQGLYNVGTMIGDFYANSYNFVLPGQNLGACCCTLPYLVGKELALSLIHICQAWGDYIRFRDYLNGHPEAARAYETLKLSLAREAPVDPCLLYTSRCV